jgi:hypothetical protein
MGGRVGARLNTLAANVQAAFLGNAYGVHDDIIVAFRHALGRAGLDVVDQLARVESTTNSRHRIAGELQQTATARQMLARTESSPEV